MFQKEVAQRIVAAPGAKAYGRLAILAQWRCDARIMLDLPPEAFSQQLTSENKHKKTWKEVRGSVTSVATTAVLTPQKT